MTKQVLDGGQRQRRPRDTIRPRVEQRGREGVAQIMRAERRIELGRLPDFGDNIADAALSEWPALAQEDLSLGPAEPDERCLTAQQCPRRPAFGEQPAVVLIAEERIAGSTTSGISRYFSPLPRLTIAVPRRGDSTRSGSWRAATSLTRNPA